MVDRETLDVIALKKPQPVARDILRNPRAVDVAVKTPVHAGDREVIGIAVPAAPEARLVQQRPLEGMAGKVVSEFEGVDFLEVQPDGGGTGRGRPGIGNILLRMAHRKEIRGLPVAEQTGGDLEIGDAAHMVERESVAVARIPAEVIVLQLDILDMAQEFLVTEKFAVDEAAGKGVIHENLVTHELITGGVLGRKRVRRHALEDEIGVISPVARGRIVVTRQQIPRTGAERAGDETGAVFPILHPPGLPFLPPHLNRGVIAAAE